MKCFLHSVNVYNLSEVLLGLQMTSAKEKPGLHFYHLLITLIILNIYSMFNSVQQRKIMFHWKGKLIVFCRPQQWKSVQFNQLAQKKIYNSKWNSTESKYLPFSPDFS